MILQQLKEFVAKPTSYEDGLKLYNNYRRNPKFDQFFAHPKNTQPGSMHYNMLMAKLKEIIGLFQRNPRLLDQYKVAEFNAPTIEVKKIMPGPASRELENLITLFQADEPIANFTYHEKVTLIKHYGLTIKGRISKEAADNALTEYRKAPKTFTPKNKTFRIIENFDNVNYDELPEDMQALYNECKQLVKETGIWQSKAKGLEEIPEKDAERKEAINKAIELEEKRQDNWNQITEWVANKDKPAKPEPTDVAKMDIINKKLNNLATNISRTKKKIEGKPNGPKVKKWKSSLDKMIADKQKLEKEKESLLNNG